MNLERSHKDNPTGESHLNKSASDSSAIRPLPSGDYLTPNRILILAVVGISVVFGLALPLVPFKLQVLMFAIFPAMVAGLVVMLNPFLGVYFYLFLEFFRPSSLIPVLQPLRLSLVTIIITFISWFIHLAISKRRIYWTRFTWINLAFVGVIGFSVIIAMNNRAAYNAFEMMMVAFLMLVIATNMVTSVDRLKNLIWLLLIIHFYFALVGTSNFISGEFVFGGQRTSGRVGHSFINDENDFALALNVMIPFAYFMIFHLRNIVTKTVVLIILMSFVLGVISSFSRGGWIGLVVVLIFCILKSKQKLAGLIIVLMVGSIAVSFAPSSYWQEIKTISDTRESTAHTRLLYWQAALDMYIDHPIIGVGADNGGYNMPAYVTGFDFPDTQWGRAFHGTLPQVLAELGTLGMACYLGMLGWVVYHLRKIRRSRFAGIDNNFGELMSNALIGSLLAYFATATFLSTLYYPQLWTLYTLACILIRCEDSVPFQEGVSRGV